MKTIPLTQGKVALVDDDLFEALNRFKWCAFRQKKTFYAHRGVRLPDGKWTNKRMHREIFELLGLPVPKTIDHRDRNGLNNQFKNLRPATHTEQLRNRGKRTDNTSGYIGVNWHKQTRKWQAHIKIDGKQRHLGLFTDAFSAAWVRDEFVKKHYGGFGVLNDLVDRRGAV